MHTGRLYSVQKVQYNLKAIGDCKVESEENVAGQHQMVVCRITTDEEDEVKEELQTKWLMLKKEECCGELNERYD